MLKDSSSPVRQFLADELPDAWRVRDVYRSALPDLPATVPVPPPGVRPAWGTLWAAVDHRLRYSLGQTVPASPGAFAGILGIGRPGLGLSPSVAEALRVAGLDLLDHLAALAAEHRPWERARPLRLAPQVEQQFSRACFAATCSRRCIAPDASRPVPRWAQTIQE
jgi:hypothetical protein